MPWRRHRACHRFRGTLALSQEGQVSPMMTVRDLMTTEVWSVSPSTPLKEAAELLVRHGVSGVPVVDPGGAVLGVLSEGDFVVKEQGPDAVRENRLARILGTSQETRNQLAKLHATTAGEAMTAPPITTEPSRPVSEAARLM